MKWNILSGSSDQVLGSSKEKIVEILLRNRGIKSKKEIENFLNPTSPLALNPLLLGVDSKSLDRAIKRIRLAIKNQEPIVVYGDYDADGICAAAIMWEALRDLKALAMPFIPLREKEGYGLSKEGIDTLIQDPRYKIPHFAKASRGKQDTSGLIITVDSGIVAHEAVEYANSKNLDVIIIDHHEKGKTSPKAFAIIHTLQLCAAGIAYFVAKSLVTRTQNLEPFLELAAIATVTDLVSLTGANRSIVKFGLEELNKTIRPGLKALFEVAGIEKVGTYEIGYMIGPRINASGRIENALTALRLLCTGDANKARELAVLLNETNRDRQTMLEEQTLAAIGRYEQTIVDNSRIIIIEHESYHQGVIGLIAGKLVEKYYLPAIVIAKGETLSKASARSISGFNIIDAIRSVDDMLINAGGHPMAAGFTIETQKLDEFRQKISEVAHEKISKEMLEKTLRVDMEIPIDLMNLKLYELLTQFAPFGMGNPEPVFASEVSVQNMRTVGKEGKHLKMTVAGHSPFFIDAIAFNRGALSVQLKVGDPIKVAYTLDLNTFNSHQNLQLKVKDLLSSQTNG